VAVPSGRAVRLGSARLMGLSRVSVVYFQVEVPASG
jgi:hypothetical protein